MFMHLGESRGSRFWSLFPFFSAVFCILLTMVPFGLSTGYLSPPSFALIAIFIWILARPDLMPPAAVFLLGILQDLFWGGPLGLWGAVFLMVWAFTISQRQFLAGRGFGLTWAVFGVAVTGSSALAWVIASIFYSTLMPVIPILSLTILSFAVYPAFAKVAPFFIRKMGESGL